MSDNFIKSGQNTFGTAYRILDISIITGLLLIITYTSGVSYDNDFFVQTVTVVALFLLFSESLELYRSWRMDTLLQQLGVTVTCWALVAATLAVIMYFTPFFNTIHKEITLYWLIGCGIALPSWRLIARLTLNQLRLRGANSRTAIIIGATASGAALAKSILKNPQYGIKLIGFCDDRNIDRLDKEHKFIKNSRFLGNTDIAIDLANESKIDNIYIAMPMAAEKRIQEILLLCGNTTANVHIIPDFFTFNLINSRLSKVGDVQTLSIYDTPINGLSSWVKRIEDLVISVGVLTVAALPMLLIAIIIKLGSRGPVLFKQDRYGLSGERIKVFKFRSMSVCDNGDKIVQAKKGDSRITPFGAFLRRTSLDELPQFFNVLGGSMSVVGPRPHAVAHNEEYRQKIGCYMLRHKVKPGITGWAQINGWRGETETIDKMEKRIEYDLDYLRRWSVLLDIKIVFLTIFKGFVGKNAY
jgi:putative colanic acid biosynthesis UDP-glucose lipid carrier transferase